MIDNCSCRRIVASARDTWIQCGGSDHDHPPPKSSAAGDTATKEQPPAQEEQTTAQEERPTKRTPGRARPRKATGDST
jgi:hypothetical protein